MILKVNPRAGLAQRGTPVPAGTGDLTIYRVVHANFPKFFLKFFVRNFPAPDAVCSEGIPARCARSLWLFRFGRTNLFVTWAEGPGLPFFSAGLSRIPTRLRLLGAGGPGEHCLCTNEIAYDGAATKLEKNCFGD
jgi:hypothetical protein